MPKPCIPRDFDLVFLRWAYYFCFCSLSAQAVLYIRIWEPMVYSSLELQPEFITKNSLKPTSVQYYNIFRLVLEHVVKCPSSWLSLSFQVSLKPLLPKNVAFTPKLYILGSLYHWWHLRISYRALFKKAKFLHHFIKFLNQNLWAWRPAICLFL